MEGEREEGEKEGRKEGWERGRKDENGREERGRKEIRKHLYSRIILHRFDVYDVTNSGKELKRTTL